MMIRPYPRNRGSRETGEGAAASLLSHGGSPAMLAMLALICFAFRPGAAPAQDQNAKEKTATPGSLIEIRAMQVAAADWVSPDAAQCRTNIHSLFQNLKRGGFNVVFFQVREGAETLYPSRIDPWSRRFSGKDPGFDPLKLAIAAGHENGIKVYAWVEAFSLGPCEAPPAATRSTHLYFSHGPDAKDSWVCRTSDGKLMQCNGEYFLSPGIPAVRAHVRSVILEIVRSYPELDGLYLSKVEYPGPDTSHDPVSVSRFHERGNPNLDDWGNWQRDQLTQFMINVSAEARAVRPTLAIGVATEGIYSRSRFEGNMKLPDALHDHYADPKAWVNDDAVDFVVPRVTEALGTGRPDYHALAEDAFNLYTEPRLVVGVDTGAFKPHTETEEWVRYPSKTGGLGIAGLSYAATAKADDWDTLKSVAFATAVSATPIASGKRAKSGDLVVTVVDSQGKPVVDAAVKLERVRRARATTGDGVAAFLDVSPGEKTLHVDYVETPPVEQKVTIEVQKIVQTTVHLSGVQTVSPVYLAVLNPRDGSETTAAAANVLGRTYQAKSASVNGVDVSILPTHLFVRDQIPLEMGKNTIQVSVTGEDGKTVQQTVEVTRVPEPTPTPLPPSFPLFIDKKTFEPNEEVRLAPDEPLRVAFVGAPDNIAEYKLPWTGWIRMAEAVIPGTSEGTGHYALTRSFVRQVDATPGNIQVRLRAPENRPTPPGQPDVRSIDFIPEHGISLYGNEVYRLLRVREDVGHLVYGLHSVRLGGPFLAEVPTGTLLHVTGRRGNYYHVRLSQDQDAWVPIDEVENEPPVTPPPHLSFDNLSVGGDDQFDTIAIPYSVHVPFRIFPVVRPGEPAALNIDFFYAHDATTWISQRPTAKEVRRVSVEQVATDHLRVHAELRHHQIWGYKAEVDGNSLKITVRRPPVIAAPPDSPLKGLTVAVEAGHGGTNLGAGGVSGTEEKNINRMTADALMAALKAKGASVVNCRIDDESVSLDTRIHRAEEANADLFISCHANSAGHSRGYLAVSGTSTYYKWDFDHDYAEDIHARLLERTGLNDFGNVGNFNYRPLRTTWMPAMLVEQAFMSNPADEAKLLDPAFRKTMVNAIVEGAEDFLREASKEANTK